MPPQTINYTENHTKQRGTLTQADMLGIDLRLPPLEEQRRIANYLDAATARLDALALARRHQAELVEIRSELMTDHAIWGTNFVGVKLKWITGPPTSGNRDHSSFSRLDRGVPCLRGLNVRRGRVDRGNLLRIAPESHLSHLGTRLRTGDVVIVRSGHVGAAAVIPSDLDDCNCVDLVVVRRSPRILSNYLELVVNSGRAQDQVKQRSAGALLTHFNAVDAGDLVVPMRPHSDQQVIADKLLSVRAARDAVRQSISTQIALLTERRQALITAAVTGQFDVSSAA